MTTTAYASLLRRYQSLVFDGVIYAIALVLAVFLPSLVELGQAARLIAFSLTIGFFLLYEALLVGFRGATLGHAHYHIRVVDRHSGRAIGPFRAFGRALLKGLLGGLSLVFMLITRRAQSLHDLAFGTIVVPADPERASALDLAVPYELESYQLPSVRRRVLVILGYAALAFVLMLVGTGLFVSLDCLNEPRYCTPRENLASAALSISWFALTAASLVLGWKGRLWGARRSDNSSHVG
jgi:uncharacterized RDD family membrane protein YckC